jgi:ATP-dependent DNA helicase RecQ
MDYIKRGEVKLLYVAPETLLTQRILSLLDGLKVDCLTIDEAHCISEWGHDFRPEYRQLAEARRRWPEAVCLALTATATPRVRADIISSLGLNAANEFVASFNRENLFIEVAAKRDSESQLTRFLERFKEQSGIIYCFSRRQVDELSGSLIVRLFEVVLRQCAETVLYRKAGERGRFEEIVRVSNGRQSIFRQALFIITKSHEMIQLQQSIRGQALDAANNIF